MKKLNLFLLGLGIISMALTFNSCTEDETPKPPTITFTGGSGYIAADDTVIVDSEFKVGITALPNSESGKELESFKVVRTFNNVPETVIDTVFSSTLESFSADIIFEAQSEVGSERITFTLTDKDGESAEISLNIYTEEGTSIFEQSNVTLNAQANGPISAGQNESFLSTSDGTKYTLNEVNGSSSDAAKVDIMFMRHSIYKAGEPDFSLRSPDQSSIEEYFTAVSLTYNASSMNTTKLKLVTSSVDWDNLDYDAIETAAAGVESGDNEIDQLDDGYIVAFLTEAGKKGLIRVVQIVDPGNVSERYMKSNIIIDYKVQE